MRILAVYLMSNMQPVVEETSQETSPREVGLTLRELEVLRGIAQAQRNYEIAEALFISTRTVEKHVENIMRKLGVKGRMQAALHLRVSSESTTSESVVT